MLTREQILSKQPKTKVVHVSVWDDTVTLRMLTVGAAQAITPDQGLVDLVIACAINADGSQMFSPEDREVLLTKEFAAMKEIAEAAAAFNGLTEKSVEELAGNSAPGLNGASSSE